MSVVPGLVDLGQIGFLQGTEDHILVADAEVHLGARLGSRAGHLLADVERAFPSVEHDYQRYMWGRMDFPEWLSVLARRGFMRVSHDLT